MCRLAAYLGPEIPLERFLLDPEHNLIKQSWQPRELRSATLNADGFGVGWYDPEGRTAAYRNVMPIWSDPNVPHLARTLANDLWMAQVRSATDSFSAGFANTQPFIDEDFIFLHNGYLGDFASRARAAIRRELAPDFEAYIAGTTDSEYLFAYLRQLLADEPDAPIDDALRWLIERVEDWCADGEALLNLLVTDGTSVYAVRHAIGLECPSLYYTTDDELYPQGQLVASEPLTETGLWQNVPPHHLLVLDPEEPPSLSPL